MKEEVDPAKAKKNYEVAALWKTIIIIIKSPHSIV